MSDRVAMTRDEFERDGGWTPAQEEALRIAREEREQREQREQRDAVEVDSPRGPLEAEFEDLKEALHDLRKVLCQMDARLVPLLVELDTVAEAHPETMTRGAYGESEVVRGVYEATSMVRGLTHFSRGMLDRLEL